MNRPPVANKWVPEIWVVMILVSALGKYMMIRYLDPQGNTKT